MPHKSSGFVFSKELIIVMAWWSKCCCFFKAKTFDSTSFALSKILPVTNISSYSIIIFQLRTTNVQQTFNKRFFYFRNQRSVLLFKALAGGKNKAERSKCWWRDRDILSLILQLKNIFVERQSNKMWNTDLNIKRKCLVKFCKCSEHQNRHPKDLFFIKVPPD